MELTLAPETQRLVEEKLKEGFYRSADEIVQAAMHALNEREANGLDEETLDEIDEAEDEIERGEVCKLEDVEEDIRAMFRKPCP